jgi:hypothetical protein
MPADGHTSFLLNVAADESANAVGQPTGGFHEFLHGSPATTFEQIQDFGCFAALAGSPAFADVAFLGALVAFLAAVVFLPDFGLDGATPGFRGAMLGLVAPLGSCAAPEVAMACSSAVVIVNSPSAVITAVTTWITPVRRRSKRILR